VVLTDEGAAFFRQQTAGRSGHGRMFRHGDGGAWKTSEQARPMKEACERAEIKPTISFHILRHTWASLAVMNGTPLLVVAMNLGHADTRMVEKHYGHLAPSFIADAIRAGAPRYRVKDDKRVVPLR
jgi:integrase